MIVTALNHLDGSDPLFTTGVGKSGIAAEFIAASFRAHGIPAHFLDPVNALHGDIGGLPAVRSIIAVSASGSTQELVRLATEVRGFAVGIYGPGDDRLLVPATDVVLETGCGHESDAGTAYVPSESFLAACRVGADLAYRLARRYGTPGLAATHPGGCLAGRRPWEE